MGYKAIVGGVTIECDSADGALEIARRAGHSDAEAPRRSPSERSSGNGPSSGSRWTDARVTEFFKLIGGAQRKVIDALIENHDGRTDEQLIQLLPGGGGGRALAGVLAGLWKNGKKVGANPSGPYEKKRVKIGD